MKGLPGRALSILLLIAGIGLILSGFTVSGILAGSSGMGLWMADFRMEPAGGSRRLVAKGSPALLLLPLMLGAGKVYMVTTSTVFSARAANVSTCMIETVDDTARALLTRLLEGRP